MTSETRPFDVTHRGVLAIAVPMTLAYLSTPLVGVVNLGVIGQLGDPAMLGGVSIGGLVFDIVYLTFNFLRAGTTGLAAQAYGAGDRREIAAILARGLLVAVALGVAILALEAPLIALARALIGGSEAVQAATEAYWETRVVAAPFALANYVVLGWLIGLGRAGYGLALQFVLNGLNIALSFAFVHELGWAVAGVGWASVAAEVVTALAGLVLVARMVAPADRPGGAAFRDRAAFARLFAVNRDLMIRTFALLFAFAFFTAEMARAGDVLLAANEVLMNLVAAAAYFLDGFAAAAEQLAGRALGARWRPAFVRAVRLTILWGFAVAIVASLAFWLLGDLLVATMTTSAEVREAARIYLPYAALVPLAGTLAYQMDGVFIGATWSVEMRNMMLLSLAAYLAAWAVAKPLLGIAGLWVAILVFVGIRGITLLWRSYPLTERAFAGSGPAVGLAADRIGD